MAKIEHVVVLMLENRSFDSMLGKFDASTVKFDGLTGAESNSFGNRDYRVRNDLPANGGYTVPTPDPGEAYTDITEQIFYDANGRSLYAASMGGFAKNYAKQTSNGALYDPQAIMHYYVAEQLPIMHQLGGAFAISDQWFASAPCQTWPNRFFAHTGTCFGIVDNNKFFDGGQEPFKRPSIFRALENSGKTWRVYFHDFPQSILLEDIMDVAPAHYRWFSQFLLDAEAGVLPAYSFIEPNYFANIFTGTPPNDQHPPHDVRYGEKLIADVYNAIRQSNCWESTLLIVTYDEHGGCYDHVVPPSAVPPGDGRTAPDGFAFDTYGVRVPALIISPWVKAGSVLQPMAVGMNPFDHTSILKSLSDLFGVPELTDRVASAPSLLPFLDLPAPYNDGPKQVTAQHLQPALSQMRTYGAELPNEYLQALATAAERLASGFETITRDLPDVPETVAKLGERAVAQVKAFLEL